MIQNKWLEKTKLKILKKVSFLLVLECIWNQTFTMEKQYPLITRFVQTDIQSIRVITEYKNGERAIFDYVVHKRLRTDDCVALTLQHITQQEEEVDRIKRCIELCIPLQGERFLRYKHKLSDQKPKTKEWYKKVLMHTLSQNDNITQIVVSFLPQIPYLYIR